MNQYLEKMYQSLLNDNLAKERIEKANGIYEEKPFVKKYANLYSSLCSFGWIPSIISVLSSSLVFAVVFPNLHIALALLIGFILAALYELLKDVTTKYGFRSFFTQSRFNGVLICSVLLYLGSIFFSSFGTIQAHEMLVSSNGAKVKSKYMVLIDSIKLDMDEKIKRAEEKATSFYNENLVVVKKGKQALRYKATDTYNSLTNRVLELEKEKETKLSNIAIEKEEAENTSSDKMKPYLYIMVIISLLVEAVIFVIRRFKEYYLYRSFAEGSLLRDPQLITLPINQLASTISLYISGEQPQIAASKEPEQMGFPIGRSMNGSAKKQDRGGKTKVKDCLQCGREYTRKTTWQKYCSKECNHKANNFKLKE